jgi:hypothetical protein
MTASSSTSIHQPQHQWKPLGSVYFKDYEKTAALTCRLLSTLSSRLIHPVLRDLFGTRIAGRGDCELNETFIEECATVAIELPLKYEGFKDCLIHVLQTDNKFKTLPLLMFFYLSLVGKDQVFDRWYRIWNQKTGKRKLAPKAAFVALREVVNRQPENLVQEWVMGFVLSLLRWEWMDRSTVATMVLDLHFRFNSGQKKSLWCTFSTLSNEYKLQVSSIVCRWCNVRHTNLVSERSVAAPVDLTTFVLLVQDVQSSDEQGLLSQSWFRQTLEALEFDEATVDVSLFLQWILCIQSAFGYRALRLLRSCASLTTRQKRWIIQNQRKLIVSDPKETVEWVVLRTQSRTQTQKMTETDHDWIGWNKVQIDYVTDFEEKTKQESSSTPVQEDKNIHLPVEDDETAESVPYSSSPTPSEQVNKQTNQIPSDQADDHVQELMMIDFPL